MGRTLLEQGNLTDAIEVLNQILNDEPGLVAGRESLRTAELARAERNEGFFKHQFAEIGGAALLVEAELCLGAHPLKAMGLAEQVLNHEPKNIGAHKIFAKAALKAGLPRTALLSLNFVFSHAPETPDVALEMVSALKQAGRATEALAICGRLLKDYPGNKRVVRTMGSLYSSERSRLASALPSRGHYDPNAGSRRVSDICKPSSTRTVIS
jgi:tetratricopeptide (TPR) repeat protein